MRKKEEQHIHNEIILGMKRRFISIYRGQIWGDAIAKIFDLYTLKDWINVNNARRSVQRLKRFNNKYKGKRCFILGNGPSLNRMDLSPLRKEFTFGLNRIFLLFNRIGFHTTFYIATNPLVIEQSLGYINELKFFKFIGWKGRKGVNFDQRTIFIRIHAKQGFSYDLAKGVWEGTTVTYVAMQTAFYLGFDKVILIGVDHSYQVNGQPHAEVISRGDDPNHFSPVYFDKGFKWNLPDLTTAEYAYCLAKEAFEAKGREIVDATVGGKLRIFRKVKYERLFK